MHMFTNNIITQVRFEGHVSALFKHSCKTYGTFVRWALQTFSLPGQPADYEIEMQNIGSKRVRVHNALYASWDEPDIVILIIGSSKFSFNVDYDQHVQERDRRCCSVQ